MRVSPSAGQKVDLDEGVGVAVVVSLGQVPGLQHVDDQVSEVPVVVDLELRGGNRSRGKKGEGRNLGSNGRVSFAAFGFLYLNFPRDGMRCSYEFSRLQKERMQKGKVD